MHSANQSQEARLRSQQFSLQHELLLKELQQQQRLLVIQDLDGVCMGLVKDPLTRTLSRNYIQAAKKLSQRFYVLTNGEHQGKRGVNAIVDQALASTSNTDHGCYLPGLGAGGVQWQNEWGETDLPGVTEAEVAFLQSVTQRFKSDLTELLSLPPYQLSPTEIEAIMAVVLLDNPLSPTININGFSTLLENDWQAFLALQRSLKQTMEATLEAARDNGLDNSFFIHYAPNLGKGSEGERIKWATENDLGTTDFQFMFKGAIKEVGVLVLLNRYYHSLTGSYPLGKDFNVRQAPHDHDKLIELAKQHFDPGLMPCIVGVGDTITSQRSEQSEDASSNFLRGGSDRGFLTLVQELGKALNRDSAVVFVDSSGGELNRPSVNTEWLATREANDSWRGVKGISDPEDPLRINFIFPKGHRQYVEFFCTLSADAKHAIGSGAT